MSDFVVSNIFGITVLLVMLLGGCWARASEKKVWNNGICKETGEAWVQFDTSSQGCRGYKSGKHYTWISWSVDNKGK